MVCSSHPAASVPVRDSSGGTVLVHTRFGCFKWKAFAMQTLHGQHADGLRSKLLGAGDRSTISPVDVMPGS